MAQLQHAHMAAGWLGRWLSCSMHPWQLVWFGQVAQLQHAHMAVGWLGKWLTCSMHTRQWEGWAGGLGAACTHGTGMVG